METQRNPNPESTADEPVSDDSSTHFDFDWEALSFSVHRHASIDDAFVDDWEDRFAKDTTGYVSDPLTTSFTDLDLGPAQLELRKTAEWAELDSWYDA